MHRAQVIWRKIQGNNGIGGRQSFVCMSTFEINVDNFLVFMSTFENYVDNF